MTFDLSIDNYKLVANDKMIVDLSKPFYKLIDNSVRKASLSYYRLSPEDLECESKYRRFYVKIDDTRYYSMIVSWERGYKSQLIYRSNLGVSELFRSKVLTHVFNSLDDQSDFNKKFRSILTKLINLIIDTYKFDYIVSDVAGLSTLSPRVTSIYRNFCVVKSNSKYPKPLNLLIKKFGGVPLRLLNWEVLDMIELDDTNLSELTTDLNGKSILLLSGINKYSCGFVYRYLKNKSVVLPVTLVSLGTY